jgi:hypothetical protein
MHCFAKVLKPSSTKWTPSLAVTDLNSFILSSMLEVVVHFVMQQESMTLKLVSLADTSCSYQIITKQYEIR